MGTIVAATVVCVCAHPAMGEIQIPDGFEIVSITQDADEDRNPRLNRCGEIVYSKDGNEQPSQIFLYDNGRIVQITDNPLSDWLPDINDNSVITWTNMGDPDDVFDSSIWIHQDGVSNQLLPGYSSEINNLDHIAFVRNEDWGCLGVETDVFFYDGETVQQITFTEALANHSVQLNDLDELVWVRYDFCPNPWESDIMLYSGGVISELTTNDIQPGPVSINNEGTVAWATNDENYFDFIRIWQEGETEALTHWGSAPTLNNLGDVAFSRSDLDGLNIFYAMLYQDSTETFYQLSDASVSTTSEDINDWGEVVLRLNYGIPHTDVSFLRRIRTGEADFDGDVDQDDYEAFAGCFTGPGRVDGLCDCRFLDIDYDGDVDCDDWQLFLAAWTGPPAAPPSLPACGCPADLNGDGTVGPTDLALVLGAWGVNPGSPADLNGDGAVNAADLAMLLGAWGPC